MLHVGKHSEVILTQSIYHMLYPQFTGLCDYSMHPVRIYQNSLLLSTLFYQQMILSITRALQKQSAEFFHPPINLLSERRGQL